MRTQEESVEECILMDKEEVIISMQAMCNCIDSLNVS